MGSGAHRKLIAWQESMKMVELVYELTRSFPHEERFALSHQLRRSAISVPSNIAEGAARNSAKELLHYVGIANGSLAELDTQLEIAARLGYAGDLQAIEQQSARLGKLLVSLRRALVQRARGSGAPNRSPLTAHDTP